MGNSSEAVGARPGDPWALTECHRRYGVYRNTAFFAYEREKCGWGGDESVQDKRGPTEKIQRRPRANKDRFHPK